MNRLGNEQSLPAERAYEKKMEEQSDSRLSVFRIKTSEPIVHSHAFQPFRDRPRSTKGSHLLKAPNLSSFAVLVLFVFKFRRINFR